MDFFEQMRNNVNLLREEVNVPVPISETMLNELIKHTDKAEETTVKITEETIRITGKARIDEKFMKKSVPFSITLQPDKAEKRQITFTIREFKPLNLDVIKKAIFNRAPYFTYMDNQIIIDFNNWEIVQRVPVGNIKKYKLINGQLILFIGI